MTNNQLKEESTKEIYDRLPSKEISAEQTLKILLALPEYKKEQQWKAFASGCVVAAFATTAAISSLDSTYLPVTLLSSVGIIVSTKMTKNFLREVKLTNDPVKAVKMLYIDKILGHDNVKGRW